MWRAKTRRPTAETPEERSLLPSGGSYPTLGDVVDFPAGHDGNHERPRGKRDRVPDRLRVHLVEGHIADGPGLDRVQGASAVRFDRPEADEHLRERDAVVGRLAGRWT